MGKEIAPNCIVVGVTAPRLFLVVNVLMQDPDVFLSEA